jgi:membrane protease YdiL (CAAX protease family)
MTRRVAALLEVLGVYLAGALLNDKIVEVLTRSHLISPQSPFALLTIHATNSELLVASRQLLLGLTCIYFSFFVLIVPLDWWRGRSGAATYGLTRAGRSGKELILAGLATAALAECPVLIHSLVDAIHPLGAMAPWRQAFFDMSWRRWQFWLFAGILSYAVIPVLEELLFRGYYQRRLAEDWGDGPAIFAVACLFTLSHKQYLIANLYNETMIISLFCLALGLGVVFAWTRSLVPSMIAHAIINVPMIPVWQGVLLAAFAVVIFFSWRGGVRAIRQVFGRLNLAAALILSLLLGVYALLFGSIPAKTIWAVGMLIVALAIATVHRRRKANPTISSVGD